MKTVVSSLVLFVSVLALGCSSGPTAPPGGGNTYRYVASAIRVPSAMAGQPIAGFNLDNTVGPTGTCNQPDFTGQFCNCANPNACESPTCNPSGIQGVDNTLAAALGGIPPIASMLSAVQDAINRGSVLLMVELTNVNDLQNDASIGLNFYLGHTQCGAVTRNMSLCDSTGQKCTLAANNTFDRDQRSLDANNEPRIRFSNASIVNGVVTAGPAPFTLELAFTGSTPVTINIRDTQIRFQISDSSISFGALGGKVNIAELAAAVDMASSGFGAAVSAVLTPMADIEGTVTPGQCDGISLGLEFQGVPVNFGPNIYVSGQDAGCPAGDAGVTDTGVVSDAGTGG